MVQGLDENSIVFDSPCLAAAAEASYPAQVLNSLYLTEAAKARAGTCRASYSTRCTWLRQRKCRTLSKDFDSLYWTAAAKVQGLNVHNIVFDTLCSAAAAEVPYPARGLGLAELDSGSRGAGLGCAQHRLRFAVLGSGSEGAVPCPRTSTRCT